MRLSVRGKLLKVGRELREEVDRHSHFALGRFSDAIRHVTVRLADVNGLHGGIDKHSRIVVVLKRGELVIAEATEVNRVLNADAMTYVASTATAILTLLYFVIRSGVLGRR